MSLRDKQRVIYTTPIKAHSNLVLHRYAIAMSLRDKQRVIYTTPIKALSNL